MKKKKYPGSHTGACILEGRTQGRCSSGVVGPMPVCEKHKTYLNEIYAYTITPRISDNIIERGEEMFLMNPKSGDMYSIGSTASFIMKELMRERLFCSIAEDMAEVFEIYSWEQTVNDCETFFKTAFSLEIIAAGRKGAIA